MGKLDKERVGGAPQSIVTPELLAHLYDKPQKSTPTVIRTDTGFSTAHTNDASSLQIRHALDGQTVFSVRSDTPKQGPQRQSEKSSQRDQKPKYNNNSSRRRGR